MSKLTLQASANLRKWHVPSSQYGKRHDDLMGLGIYLLDYTLGKVVGPDNLALVAGIVTARNDFADGPVLDSAGGFLGHKD
jgi:hypothetical protein